jgi:hypothetical protein
MDPLRKLAPRRMYRESDSNDWAGYCEAGFFQAHGVDKAARAVLGRKLRENEVAGLFSGQRRALQGSRLVECTPLGAGVGAAWDIRCS